MATATQVQRRRGTRAQCNGMVPVEGEIIVDTTDDIIRVGDGTKAGGFPVPNAKGILNSQYLSGDDSGSTNALVITLYEVPAGYTKYMQIRFVASNTNTGSTTVNVNALGNINVYKITSGGITTLAAGDIRAGGIYDIIYDGTQFQLINVPSVGSSGLTSVGQGDLRTSTGTFSSTIASGAGPGLPAFGIFIGTHSSPGPGLTLTPGGQYGFQIETAFGNSGGSVIDVGGWVFSNTSSGSYLPYVSPFMFTRAGGTPFGLTSYGQQRYITSSPPFDMGDGEVGGFVFVKTAANGEIIQTYAADVPPWGYNGPTDIRCTHKCPVSGKKYRQVKKKRTFDQVMAGTRSEYVTQEITNEIKNADMPLIPHPFHNKNPGENIILLDPMSDKTRRIIEHINDGGGQEINEKFNLGHFEISNDKLKRKGPAGVHVSSFKYKKSL